MRAPTRSLVLLAAVLALTGIVAGCGSNFPLPTQLQKPFIPEDQSYTMKAAWTGMDGINDILLTQQGSQLFLLFNWNPNGTGTAVRGEVKAYPLSKSEPLPGFDFSGLFNPVALCASRDHIFVLDQGDSCMARTNPATGRCDSTSYHVTYGSPPRDTVLVWDNRVVDYDHYWKVCAYGLLGGAPGLAPVAGFTDTTMAWVNGIAADASNNVYISGVAIKVIFDYDRRGYNRYFSSVIYKYTPGPRYPGVVPADRNTNGADWHRDTTWSIEQGTGFGYVVDPRGLHWGPFDGGGIYCAVYGRNYAQRFSDIISNTGDPPAMAEADGLPLEKPVDVYSDLKGFVYVADRGNKRVLRFAPDKSYVQRVDVAVVTLQDPVAVAADDSLVYVGDRALGQVIRYQRLK
jgi:hypothetical protein